MIIHPVGALLPGNLSDIEKMVELLKEKDYPGLGLICTGSSGSIIAGIIASKLIPTPRVYYIKKRYEHTHTHGKIGIDTCKNFVFVDDFIRSGKTAKHVIKQLKLMGINKAKAILMSDDVDLNKPYITKFFEEQLCI